MVTPSAGIESTSVSKRCRTSLMLSSTQALYMLVQSTTITLNLNPETTLIVQVPEGHLAHQIGI